MPDLSVEHSGTPHCGRRACSHSADTRVDVTRCLTRDHRVVAEEVLPAPALPIPTARSRPAPACFPCPACPQGKRFRRDSALDLVGKRVRGTSRRLAADCRLLCHQTGSPEGAVAFCSVSQAAPLILGPLKVALSSQRLKPKASAMQLSCVTLRKPSNRSVAKGEDPSETSTPVTVSPGSRVAQKRRPCRCRSPPPSR